MTTPQQPGGSNPPQWNNPGQQPPYQGQQPQYPGQQPPQGQYPGYPGGQPPGYDQGYGQGGYGQHDGGMTRPGGVTAAGYIAIALTSLAALFWFGLGITALVAPDSVIDSDWFQAGMEGANYTTTELRDGIVTLGVMMIIIGLLTLLGLIPAIAALRGSNAGRIILVVLAALTILAGVFFIGLYGSGLLWIAGSIAVIVLLFVGGANRWFQSKRH